MHIPRGHILAFLIISKFIGSQFSICWGKKAHIAGLRNEGVFYLKKKQFLTNQVTAPLKSKHLSDLEKFLPIWNKKTFFGKTHTNTKTQFHCNSRNFSSNFVGCLLDAFCFVFLFFSFLTFYVEYYNIGCPDLQFLSFQKVRYKKQEIKKLAQEPLELKKPGT